MKTQKSIHTDSIRRSLKALSLVLWCAIAGPLALLSTGRTATEGRNPYVRVLSGNPIVERLICGDLGPVDCA
jgi:hypothetical protein